MVGKSKNFTIIEKRLFISILPKYSSIVEAKKSNAASLIMKEEAWEAISAEFNSSAVVVEKRTVMQLKKLWTNIKQSQRGALTKERQQVLATGGGPTIRSIEIDPDVSAIVPHLMEVATSDFTSNMSSTELVDAEEALQAEDIVEEMEIFPITLAQPSTSRAPDVTLAQPSTSRAPDVTLAQPSTSHEGPIPARLSANSRADKRKRQRISSPNADTTEGELKIRRLYKIIEQEEELFQIKLEHNKRIMALEIRAATAVARRAELLLERETKN